MTRLVFYTYNFKMNEGLKMYGSKYIKHLLYSAALGATLIMSFNGMSEPAHSQVKSYTPVAYDISEFQGHLTRQQVLNLKKEVKFVILRVQDGQYHDHQVNNNIRLMQRYGVPYGVYSYSRYTNSRQAAAEARRLHRLAPRARFYVNDFETSYTRRKEYASNVWAKKMKSLAGGNPIVLYGSKSMLDSFKPRTLGSYNNVWLADYTNYMPNPRYQYDLWQYTDRYPSNALGERLDADVIPIGGKDVSYWTKARHYHKKRPVKRRVKHMPKKQVKKVAYHVSHKRRTYRHVKLHKVVKKSIVKKIKYRYHAPKYKRLTYKVKKSRRYYNLKHTKRGFYRKYSTKSRRVKHITYKKFKKTYKKRSYRAKKRHYKYHVRKHIYGKKKHYKYRNRSKKTRRRYRVKKTVGVHRKKTMKYRRHYRAKKGYRYKNLTYKYRHHNKKYHKNRYHYYHA